MEIKFVFFFELPDYIGKRQVFKQRFELLVY